jgi:hypothetical protein
MLLLEIGLVVLTLVSFYLFDRYAIGCEKL